MNDEMNADSSVDIAKRVLEIEAEAIRSLIPRLGDELPWACRLCRQAQQAQGRIVVIGMGKSGHVGRKIAATLASTGSPAFFVHAGEAAHGDMGMITPHDVVLAISNSGETQEIAALLPAIKSIGVPLITMSGEPRSTLARAATVNLDISVAEEACPLNLAPTASTTATLAMGDALAIVLREQRGFELKDFADYHPGGVLGTRIEEVMHTGEEIPQISAGARVGDGLVEMTRKSLGITAVVDDEGRLMGVFTDGDLRRTLDKRIDIHEATMEEVMTPGGKTLNPGQLAVEAVRLLESFKITALLVVDREKRVVGALNIHDLFRAGVM